MFSGSHCRLRAHPHRSSIDPGTRIVVSIAGPRGLRILGIVVDTDSEDIEVRVVRVVHKDKRNYPRVSASVDLRYHVLTDQDPVSIQDAWCKGLQDVSHVFDWASPHTFVNFSRSGLQFTDKWHCAPGDMIMIELQLPKSSMIHRLTGQVMRVEEITKETRARCFEAVQHSRVGDTHAVAVRFHDAARSVEEALSRATVEQQIREIEWKHVQSAEQAT
jgi:hypothetical protein